MMFIGIFNVYVMYLKTMILNYTYQTLIHLKLMNQMNYWMAWKNFTKKAAI